jgi:NAD(P)-dependent dehydrogenase (short-subunit alcohol dehydrogenase family)
VKAVSEKHGGVDILINNAGRSIRRAIENSFDRFHDYERCMATNYFGAVRLTMGLLPAMIGKRRGHVINISSIGVLANAPRFSAYVASKAALEGFSRCAAAEYAHRHVAFTVINMPLVRTPMIAPTRLYDQMPTISPEEAADLVAEAIIRRPQRLATRLGLFAQWVHLLAPKLSELVMSTAYRMFPETAGSPSAPAVPQQPTPEAMRLAQILRGVHW